MVRPVFALLASTLLFSGISQGQESRSAVRETAQAVLVEVPVRVVDRSGNPVRGLGIEDFELYDEGKKQVLVAADVVDLAEKGFQPPKADEDVAPAARRHFLFLFDLSFSEQKAILTAQRAAKEFVLT